MSSTIPITDQRHNDYVGTDANVGRIPGAATATTGHHYEAVFPKDTPRRAEEHLPPPTGRDRPPRHDVPGPDITRGVGDKEHVPPSDRGAGPSFDELNKTRVSDLMINRDPYATPPSAADTLTGATSADVHDHYGHPGQGMTSAEAHHDGVGKRKRDSGNAETLYGSGERLLPSEE